MTLLIGSFMEAIDPPYSEWGTGKLVSVGDEHLTLNYFDSPDSKSHITLDLPFTKVRQVSLPTQSRVYRRHTAGGRWQVGRVLYHEGNSKLLVQFPNGEADNFEASDLEVRWNKPIKDPLPFLIAEATETPFLAEARSAFVRATSAQHSACSGMTSVLSAAIELEDYQFNIARRILTDPIQRYLLADEVGLGKTIEACIVIRQYMLDEPSDAVVVVVAPDVLLSQWREELTRRFALGSFLDDFVHVVGHSEIERLSRVLPSAGLIVVDEAHHLSRQVSGQDNELYNLLRGFATKVARLLLLSATPVLSDSAGFLRVMHLLDPVIFPLTDLAGFQRRLESRQLVAEVVATLLPENVWSIADELDRLVNAFNDDPLLAKLIDELRVILDDLPEEDDEQFVAALRALKTHLGETYRLHRRVLRNRRVSVPWATIRRKGLQRFEFESRSSAEFSKHLDNLRLHLSAIAELNTETRQKLLRWAIQPRACDGAVQLLSVLGIDDPEAKNLAGTLDQTAQAVQDSDSRFQALRDAVIGLLRTKGLQVVIFCDSKEDADRAEEVLEKALRSEVKRHQILDRSPGEDKIAEDRPLPWKAFLTDPSNCRVLVCDARAEEGVNLHGGHKVALHFDAPPSPNRIEQRLGRLDRYGTGEAVRSLVLVDTANPNEHAWVDILEKAWEVFDRSVASLQYLIEESGLPLLNDWVDRGIEAFGAQLAVLAGPEGRVAKELRRINQQDALDALENPNPELLDELVECDGDWRAWRSSFDAFAIKALMFERRVEATRQGGDEVFRVGYVRKGNHPTLLPLSRFLKVFREAVDREAPGGTSQLPLTHRYAFQRRTVTSQEGLNRNIHLLRIGDPLITALERFCEIDDRGRIFGLWRVRGQEEVNDPSGADLYFRFDFVVEPGEVAPGKKVGTEHHFPNIHRQALSRLAGATLPPLFFTVWVSGSGKVVLDPPEALLDGYRDGGRTMGRADFNLNPARWRVLHQQSELTWLRNWEEICTKARDAARQFVLDSQTYGEHVDTALDAASRQHQLRLAQGKARMARMTGATAENEARELTIDDHFFQDLIDSLRTPNLRLEGVGAVFLANHSPFTS